MKKGIIALICMVITLVFIIVALVGTWYGGHGEVESMGIKGEVDYSFGLTGGEGKSEFAGQKETTEIEYDDDFDAKGVYDNTMYITIIALITAIIALICILGMTFNFGNIKTMKMLGGIFGILTVIFALVAAIYFMTALPEENRGTWGDVGFWDEVETSLMGVSMKLTVGPGYAWYLMIVSFITASIGSIIVFMDKPGPTMAPPQ